jgi:hypothetical protein
MLHDLPSAEPHPSPEEFHPGRVERKTRRKEKRLERQAERARIRERLEAGLRDPEAFLDLEASSKNLRRMLASGREARRALLEAQQRKVKSELANTRDLETFLAKACRSRTLHSFVAVGFFREVWRSEAYRADHRYKLAIRNALEDPGLAKSIQHKWEQFDRRFPGPSQ